MLRVRHVLGYVIAGVVGGFVIAQLAGGFFFAGAAPPMQGWSQGKQDRLTLLGEGGCRTADGGPGEHHTTSTVSLEECKAKCLDMGGDCTALEYNSNNGNCEIHSDTITLFEQVAGVSCYYRE